MVLMLGLLAACGPGSQQPARPAADEASPAAAIPKASVPPPDWKIKLEVPPDVKAHQPAEVLARVQDGAGKPLEGAVVEVSLVMTTMDMGENKSRLSPRAPGVYGGRLNFTMSGPWEAYVSVSRDGKTAVEKVAYTVK